VAVVLVLNRLMAPRALVNIADWVGRTVLTHRLGVSAAKFNDDRLGRTLDAIAPHQREIWQDVVHEALLRFEIDLSFIFYDLTAFVMQGEFKDSAQVEYGFAHNTLSGKQKIKQALSVARDGKVPLEYAPTSGRTADLATVQENMERLYRLLQRRGYPVDQVVIIGDRGTLNDEIALQYDEEGFKYLAGLKAQRKEYAELLAATPKPSSALTRWAMSAGAMGCMAWRASFVSRTRVRPSPIAAWWPSPARCDTRCVGRAPNSCVRCGPSCSPCAPKSAARSIAPSSRSRCALRCVCAVPPWANWCAWRFIQPRTGVWTCASGLIFTLYGKLCNATGAICSPLMTLV